MKKLCIFLLTTLLLTGVRNESKAQICDPTVPLFTVNLTGNPNGTWTSPFVYRNGLCCSASGSNVCVEFIITLDSAATGISFDIISGAVPGGALFYQINCGPPSPLGSPICLSGVGPHYLTFCKPGNNNNQYQIQSIPQPSAGGTQWISEACVGMLTTQGLDESTITWTSVPNNPVYNSFLSCPAGCDTVIVTPTGVVPSYVDYMVCGASAGACGVVNFCDTVRVNFVSTLAVAIAPQSPTICFGGPNATVTANPAGGLAPYSYIWSNGATTQSVSVGAGTYTVQITDAMNCSHASDTVTVYALPSPIDANAGTDQVLCTGAAQAVALNGSVVAATGGIWINGTGTFSPNNSTLNAIYTPSIAEINAGTATLLLVTTGNSGCPADTDVVQFTIAPQPTPVIAGPAAVCHYSSQWYVASNPDPVAYSWQVNGGTITGNYGDSISVLWTTGGTGSVSLYAVNTAGCDTTVQTTVAVSPQPAPALSGATFACTPVTEVYHVTNAMNDNVNWTVFGGTVIGSSTADSVVVQWNGSGTGTVIVVESNSLGCDSALLMTVALSSTPVTSISGLQSMCGTSILTYAAAPSNAVTHNWTVTGGYIVMNYGNSIDVQWTNTGTNTVTLTAANSNGCDTTLSYSVNVYPQPAPSIAGSNFVCTPEISVYHIVNPSGTSYNWNVFGGNVSGSSSLDSVTVGWNSAGTGTVILTETNAFGCDTTVAMTINLSATPVTSISGIQTFCGPQQSLYTAAPSNAVTYNWNVSNGSILVNNNNQITVQWNSVGTGTITLTAMNAQGCDTTLQYNAIINPQPSPVIAGPLEVCTPGSATFSLSPASNSTFSWLVNGGYISSSNGNDSIQVQFNSTGAGSVVLTETNSFGCDTTVTYSVTLNPYPVPVIIGDNFICNLDTAVYSVTPVTGHTYDWSVSGGTIVSFTVSHEVEVYWFNPGTGSLRVSQTSMQGCETPDTLPVTVNPLPVPFVTGPDVTCLNDLENYSTPSNAGSNYTWAVSGGSITGSMLQPYANVNWTAIGQGQLLVTETDVNGCIGTAPAMVLINPLPAASISGSQVGCVNPYGSSYTATPMSNVFYQWSINGGSISGSNGQNHANIVWNNTGIALINLQTTNLVTGCTNTTSLQVLVDSMSQPQITANSFTGCVPFDAAFASTPTGTNYSYQWSFGDGLTSQEVNATHTYYIPGSYLITLIATNNSGCWDTVHSQVNIYNSPVASFHINIEDEFYPADETSFSLQNTSAGAVVYQWDFGDGNSSTAFEPAYHYPGAGSYVVTLVTTNLYGCRDTMTTMVEIKVPEEIYIPNAFTPNGDSQNDGFSISGRNISELRIAIFNRWGQEVYTSNQTDFVWDGTYFGHLVQEGVYVYKILAKGVQGKYFEKIGTVSVMR